MAGTRTLPTKRSSTPRRPARAPRAASTGPRSAAAGAATTKGARRQSKPAARAERKGRPGSALPIVEWIVKKRDGGHLSEAEIQSLVKGFLEGRVTDYQMSAWLMATTLRGMDLSETAALTAAMLHSGEQITHPSVKLPTIDKHSTGGVGDKLSLCLAPWVAACDVAVPMISGRGLGHTGGTLDKLEAIPGYQTRLTVARFQAIVRRVGVSIIGQTEDLAPADRRIYSLRDVTGTVESMPLICASILSKKLAAGLKGLVLDVKVGAGAFMKTLPAARELARLLMRVGRQLGLPISALLTDMSTPIGSTIGNALETAEAIRVLRKEGPPDTLAITQALAEEMLRLAYPTRPVSEHRARLQRALDSGAALEKLAEMVAAHGGDHRVVHQPSRLPVAPMQVPLLAARSGYLASLDAGVFGLVSVSLGAGRARAEDEIDPRVGLELCARVGDKVEKGQPLVLLHCRTKAEAAAVLPRLTEAVGVTHRKPKLTGRVLQRLT